MCEIWSKLTIKTPEQSSGVFLVNFEQILQRFDVSIANFETVNTKQSRAKNLVFIFAL